MTRDETLDLLRAKGLELVAHIIDSENPRAVTVRIEYDRQIAMLGSLLKAAEETP